MLRTAPGATGTPGALGLQAPEAHAQAGGRGRARRLGYRLLCNAGPGVLEPRARKGPRAAAAMQKYEKLEKIGEGNGTARCPCKIFCRPFSIPYSPGSSTVTAIPTDSDLSTGCSPGPPAQHSMQTAILPLLAFPMDAPLPTLALPVTHLPTSTSCISSPSSAPLAQPHPAPASVPAADLQPLHSCWPSLLSQTPAPNFQTLQKLGLCDRPPHLAPAASACCRHP